MHTITNTFQNQSRHPLDWGYLISAFTGSDLGKFPMFSIYVERRSKFVSLADRYLNQLSKYYWHMPVKRRSTIRVMHQKRGRKEVKAQKYYGIGPCF